MRRSSYRRAAAAPSGRSRRLFAVGAVVAAMGAAVAFTTISNAAEGDRPVGSGAGKVVNGQVILTDTCVDSNLPAHDGFQLGNRCVSTEFGEVGAAANNPTLLITEAPQAVAVNTPFTLKISTRNLIRDRFLAAGKGGYYVESSVLQNGLVRGHFHTACRMLGSTNEAPAPEPVPAFFVATEDSRGNATPDEVTIQVPGLPNAGTAQCASWAGDGSHRIPMMERANQTPALDAVRITVGGDQGGDDNGGGDQGGDDNGGGDQGGDDNGGDNGGGDDGNQGDGNQGDGNQGDGDNGGNQGGGDATTPPTAPAQGGATTAPTTRDDFTPDPTTKPAKPATATKPATGTTRPATTPKPKPATNGTTGEDTGEDTSDRTESEQTAPATKSTTKAAKPTASKSAGSDFTYSNEDGQFNSGNKAPVAEQVAEAKNASAQKETGILALTGTNAIAAVGAAAVLLLIGLILMAFTRRRRPGTTWE